MTELGQRLAPLIEGLVQRLDRLTGGWATLLRQIFVRFGETRGAESAASLAYYALFSLFPLTLMMAAVLGLVVKSDTAFAQVTRFIRLLFPFSDTVLVMNLKEVSAQGGAVGALGFVGLLWAASGFFNTLERSINLAWPKVKLRGFVHSRLVALGMVGALFLLMLLSLLSSTLVGLLPYLGRALGWGEAINQSVEWLIVVRLAPPLFTMIMFTALYRWVPSKNVTWRAVLTGGLAATLLWEGAKVLFTVYLGSGLARYQSVYGSLGTLIALMVWIYFSNLISLLGAYLVAAVDVRAELPDPVRAAEPAAGGEPAKGLHG